MCAPAPGLSAPIVKGPAVYVGLFALVTILLVVLLLL
jgi:hypothetical protein